MHGVKDVHVRITPRNYANGPADSFQRQPEVLTSMCRYQNQFAILRIETVVGEKTCRIGTLSLGNDPEEGIDDGIAGDKDGRFLFLLLPESFRSQLGRHKMVGC